MRLGLLVGQFPPGVFGGAEAQAEQWALRLARHHGVTVVARRGAPGQPMRQERDGFEVLRTVVSPVPGWRTAADIAAICSRVRSLPMRPHLLLCFQTFLSGLAGVYVQARLGCPAVVWVRGDGEYDLQGSARARAFSVRVWNHARGILVQSEANRNALLEQVRRRDRAAASRIAAKVKIVPNGIELPERPVTGGRKVLVLGRLIPNKGVDVVIDAMAGLLQAELLVVGDGPERARLEELARSRRVQATFLGAVSRDALPSVLAEARCLVLASRAGEGVPNVLLEAMAWGVPVVATPTAGVRDLVRHGENGLRTPVGDPLALRAALSTMLHDTDLRVRLITAGRATAADHAWEQVTPRLEAALLEWTASGPSTRHQRVMPSGQPPAVERGC